MPVKQSLSGSEDHNIGEPKSKLKSKASTQRTIAFCSLVICLGVHKTSYWKVLPTIVFRIHVSNFSSRFLKFWILTNLFELNLNSYKCIASVDSHILLHCRLIVIACLKPAHIWWIFNRIEQTGWKQPCETAAVLWRGGSSLPCLITHSFVSRHREKGLALLGPSAAKFCTLDLLGPISNFYPGLSSFLLLTI